MHGGKRKTCAVPVGLSLCLLVLCGCGGWLGGLGGSNNDSSPSASGVVIDSFTPPTDSTAVSGDQVAFKVNAHSEQAISYRWSYDGVPLSASDSQYVLPTDAADTRTHTVMVEVSAGDGEPTSVVWHLRLVAAQVNQPPEITGAIPSGAVTITQGNKVTLSITASDPDATDQVFYSWWLDGREQSATGSSFQLDTTGMSAGTHQVTVIAYDGNQHSTSDPEHTFTVTVELAPVVNHAPVIDSVSPSSGSISITAGSSLNLTVNASDPDSNTLTYRWTIDGTSVSGSASTYRYSPGAAEVGVHAIKVRVDDGKSNQDGNSDPTYTWSVTVESAPGTLELVLGWDPVVTDVQGQPKAVIGYRVYLALSPGAFTTVYKDLNTTSTVLTGLTSGGTYYAAVTAYDASGSESAFSEGISFQAP